MTEEQQQEEQGHDCTQHANQLLSPGHVPDLTTSAFHAGQGIEVSNLAMEIRSQERKRLARERQHPQRQNIRVNAEVIQWVREEDRGRHAKERLSIQAHVQEHNQQQLQSYHANMTEEQQQEQQAHDHSRHAIQRLSNQKHV